MLRTTWLPALALGAALASPACGGGTGGAGSGGATPGSGGAASGSGGTASGGSAAGGAATGGVTASGGASASGGTGSGSGGSTSASGWEEVRCFQYQQTTTRTCYAKLGNLWSVVAPVCGVEGNPHYPMTRNQTSCGGVDDGAGWDETWCDDLQCYGRLGDWLTVVGAPCDLPSQAPSDQTPTEALCGAAAEAPTVWQDVACYEASSATFLICYGFLGIYYPTWGLIPSCQLEANAADPDYVEVTPDPTCP